MSSKLALLRKTLTPLGASIDEASLQHDAIVVDAPAGKVWSATGTHAMREECSNGQQTWFVQAERNIVERVRLGLEACKDLGCDVCEEAL